MLKQALGVLLRACVVFDGVVVERLRYFYDWETFTSVEELNKKLKDHLEWSNSKKMRTLDWKSAKQLLAEKLSA